MYISFLNHFLFLEDTIKTYNVYAIQYKFTYHLQKPHISYGTIKMLAESKLQMWIGIFDEKGIYVSLHVSLSSPSSLATSRKGK